VNFIIDGMLGGLTRWLRMMGHDVKYSAQFDDVELLAVAKQEKRVLLTRDFALYVQATSKGLQTLYVDGETEPERLAEVAGRFNIPLQIDLTQSRCPKCNTKLSSVPKQQIQGKVEENTFKSYSEFWLCSNCGAVYWQGAHWKNIETILRMAKQKLKEEREKAT
jgi:uncharacterized protein